MNRNLVVLIIFVVLESLAAAPAFSQEAFADGRARLARILSELERMRDEAALQIDRAQSRAVSAEQILARARQEGNSEAARLAEQASAAARSAGSKAREKKLKAEEAVAGIQSLLALKADPRSRAVAGGISGDVKLVSKRSQKTLSLDAGRPAGLEPGDEVVTAGNGRARVYVLGGRGAIDVGEETRLSVKENAQGGQVVDLRQGKIDVTVEKIQAYEQTMGEYLKSCASRLSAAGRATEQEIGEALEEIRATVGKFAQRFEIRTPTAICGVRGTRLSVRTDELTGTEITVFEGRVDLKDIKGRAYPFEAAVDGGYRVHVSPDGIIAKPEKFDLP